MSKRKRYAITDAEGWPASPEKPEPYLQSTLYTKVVPALLTGRSAADLLDTQRSERLRLMRILTDRKRRGDLPDQLVRDHALFHLEADLPGGIVAVMGPSGSGKKFAVTGGCGA